MEKDTKKVLCLLARYLMLISVSAGNFYVFYKLLTRPTIGALTTVLGLFFDISVSGSYIFANGALAEIDPSCIAVSAFFLLLILVMTTADIKPAKRITVLAVSFAILFTANIARMVFLVFIIHKPYFDTVHLIFEHMLSTLIVVAIWICVSRIAGIKTIPVYSDILYLLSLTRKRSNRKRVI